jgi:hypothetical protein
MAPKPLISLLAARMTVEIDSTPTAGSPTWIPVRGVAELDPKLDQSEEDDTDYDTDGWGSSVVTLLTWSLTLKLIRKAQGTTDAYDPGQEVIRTAHDQLGGAALVHVRWYDKAGLPEAYEGWASVKWSSAGGDSSKLDIANVILGGNGAREAITNPVAA